MKIKQFPMTLFGVNTYVVWDEATKCCAIIDPGMIDDEERMTIDNFISDNALKVTHLINTHLHVDHVFSDAYVSRRYGVGITASKGDDFLLRHIADQAEMFGLGLKPDSIEVTTNINDGDTIVIGSGSLKVIHVPGHSPGSMVFYDADGGFVVTGDVLFEGSVGRADLPGGNFPQLIEGIKRKLLTLPPETRVYPGHGPATTIAREMKLNPFLLEPFP